MVLSILGAILPNCYYAKMYGGVTKWISISHLPSEGLYLIYLIIRLTVNTLPKNNYYIGYINSDSNSMIYGLAIYLCIFNGVAVTFDIIDIYIWCIKKDRIVVRSDYLLQLLIENGELPKDTPKVQVLYKNDSKVVNDDLNKYGKIPNDQRAI